MASERQRLSLAWVAMVPGHGLRTGGCDLPVGAYVDLGW